MDTYPGGQGVVNVAVRKNVNKLLHTYLIKLLTPYWPKIDQALNVLEYDDDASLLHVRNAHGNIVERMPLVPLLIAKLKQKTYKGGLKGGSSTMSPCARWPQRGQLSLLLYCMFFFFLFRVQCTYNTQQTKKKIAMCTVIEFAILMHAFVLCC